MMKSTQSRANLFEAEFENAKKRQTPPTLERLEAVPENSAPVLRLIDCAKENADALYGTALSILTVEGRKTETHWKQSADCLLQAVELSDARHGPSLTALAYCFIQGLGVKKDVSHGLKLFEQAAALDDATAQFNLGVLYEDGIYLTRNSKKAVTFYKKAADQNHKKAALHLAEIYDYGREGIPKDPKRAVIEYTRAAELGVVEAQYTLGIILATGHGVKKQVAQGVHFLKKAHENGSQDATELLFRIASQPDPELKKLLKLNPRDYITPFTERIMGKSSAKEISPKFETATTAKEWGEIFKAARKEKGLTQKALGQEIGISEQQVANIENGRSFPGFETVLNICKVTGRTLALTKN